jgi:predicted Zn finger-like uncharacterized protein
LILTCERCETRFRLDEGRLPAGGARVRCSRCKHAFFVNPGGAAAPDVVHELAEAAVTQTRMPAPAPAWDLEDDVNGRTAASGHNVRSPVAPDLAATEFEEESDWRFEDEMHLGDAGASLDLPNGEAPIPASVDANESSFAELGDPESWDLLSSPAIDPSPPPAVPCTTPAAPPIERVVTKLSEPEPREPTRDIATVERAPEARRVVPDSDLAPALTRAAWTALAALAALATWTTVVPATKPTPRALGVVSLGALELTSLRARQLENAVAGDVWVVSGEVHNPSQEPRALGSMLAVTLLDSTGARVGDREATLRPGLEIARLREEDPRHLDEESAAVAMQFASQPLQPGGTVAVDAVFTGAAPGAARFAVEARPLN